MTKTDEALTRLRSDILSCRLAPDSPLVVAALTERYGLGWTPLREALSRLEAERLVISERNRGYRVAPVSAASLVDLQEARRAVESTLLRRSIEAGGAEWEGQVVAAHYLLAQTPPPDPVMAGDRIAQWEARHDAFHDALLAGDSSVWLAGFQHQIREQLTRHHRHMISGPAPRRKMDSEAAGHFQALIERTLGLAHHTELMEATLARDADRAISLLNEHIGFSLAVYAFLWPEDVAGKGSPGTA